MGVGKAKILFIMLILSGKAFRQDEQDLHDVFPIMFFLLIMSKTSELGLKGKILRNLSCPIGSAFSFELKVFGPEVQQQTNFDSCRRQIVHQLHFIGRSQGLVCLQFDHDTLLNQHIRREITNDDAVILDSDRFLALDAESGFFQFVG